MKRLSQSIRILSNQAPQFLFLNPTNLKIVSPSAITLPIWQPTVQMLVNDSMRKALPIALKERSDYEELAITIHVSGNLEELNVFDSVDEERVSKILDVTLHLETYRPPAFGILENAAHLAVAGCGRYVAAAKYSDWVRIRKNLEKAQASFSDRTIAVK